MKKILTVFGFSAFFIGMNAFHHHYTLYTDIQTGENGAAADDVGSDEKEPYIPESSSTWGDLYRYFDSQGFEKLPEEMQAQLDSIPLERADSRPVEALISTQAYLYPQA